MIVQHKQKNTSCVKSALLSENKNLKKYSLSKRKKNKMPFWNSKPTEEEEKLIDDLKKQQRKQLESLFEYYQVLEKYRDELQSDLKVLQKNYDDAKAAKEGPALPPSAVVKLGDAEMTEDDAVDWVAEVIQFSNKYSSMK